MAYATDPMLFSCHPLSNVKMHTNTRMLLACRWCAAAGCCWLQVEMEFTGLRIPLGRDYVPEGFLQVRWLSAGFLQAEG